LESGGAIPLDPDRSFYNSGGVARNRESAGNQQIDSRFSGFRSNGMRNRLAGNGKTEIVGIFSATVQKKQLLRFGRNGMGNPGHSDQSILELVLD
jgi:hypothetical protein